MSKEKAKDRPGRLFGRPDIERCDLFIDNGFLNWGIFIDGPVIFHEASKKGRQMYSSVPSGGHKKCGLQAASGYFDPEFKTISVNERYVEKWKILGRPSGQTIKRAWVPSGPAKKHSTPGDHYGTFTKFSEAKAFSPLVNPLKKFEKELINFLTNPGKKGNCGFVDIGINKYPLHVVNGKIDSYGAAELLYSKRWKDHKEKIRNGPLKSGFFPRPYFEPNPYIHSTVGPTYVKPREKEYGTSRGVFYPPSAPKSPGNNHDGCFTKFPAWSPEPYVTSKDVEKILTLTRKSGLIFRPEPRLKTYYTVSIVNNKIDLACNENTWRKMKPITYSQFNL